MANGRAAWAGRRRRAAALRKRRGSGEDGGRGEAGAGRPGGKAGPDGRVLGRAGPAGPPRARREASGPRQGSPSASREEDPARLIPLAAQSGGGTFFYGSVHGLFSGAFSLRLGCNFAGRFQESGSVTCRKVPVIPGRRTPEPVTKTSATSRVSEGSAAMAGGGRLLVEAAGRAPAPALA
ncbi:uncharacterized protein LOC141736875 [Larus michahellis]|uniref:uncharacterized protein LOC141736875 n=1 Tax=Larus michahellis TaxID=119627 RepID=UPI003D9B2D0A